MNYYPLIYQDLDKIKMNLEVELEYFEGIVKKGKKQGFCRMIYNTGVVIEGFYDENLIQTGSIIFSNGVEYRGEFQNNVLDGEGSIFINA